MSITVLAGIGIVLGALFSLCKPANALFVLLVKLPVPNPVMDLFRNDPAIRAFTIGDAATGTLLSVLLLMCSLGSLALKPWARSGMIAYACLALLMTAVGQAVAISIIAPEIERAIRQSGMPQPPGMAWMSGWVGLTLGILLRLWYPALILYYYTRPRAREAFARGLPGKGI